VPRYSRAFEGEAFGRVGGLGLVPIQRAFFTLRAEEIVDVLLELPDVLDVSSDALGVS
jgi:hypothetical protein